MQTHIGTPPDPLHQPAELLLAAPVSRARRYGWLGLIAAGPSILVVLRLLPALDQPLLHDALLHVLIVSGATLLGMVLALLSLHIALRAQDGRVFLVGMGFLAIASIFFTHGISTPDVLMSGRGLATGLSAILSLVLGSMFFALSGIAFPNVLNRRFMRKARLWLVCYLIFWLIYNWTFLALIPSLTVATLVNPAAAAESADPQHQDTYGVKHDEHAEHAQYAEQGSAEQTEYVEPAPPGGLTVQINISLDTLRLPFVLIGLACFVFAAVRHYLFYRRSPSQAGLAITCGIILFGEALLTQYVANVYTSSFWLYHAQEFIGFGVISYAVLGAYRRGQDSIGLLESLFLSGTRARFQADNVRAMEALIATLSRGERPTPALRDTLRTRFVLSESQVQVLESAATAVAQERRQRQELERLNDALRQLEQDKSELTQMIVHDLKNPLTALVGFLEILQMERLTDDQRLLLESALRSGKNLSGLIGDLLDVDRIEEGRMELERSHFAPRELLAECAAEMRAWLKQDAKTVEVAAPADLPPLYADLRLMRRVVLNLLSNAIKHTPPGTHIILRAAVCCPHPSSHAGARGPDRFIMEIQDNGPGIPAEHLDHIFEKFGRFSGDRSSRQSSTGLGLTFCRLAVEAHGGSIGVVSVVGQGATFRMTLPSV
jgi:signal transduction histidine kinase